MASLSFCSQFETNLMSNRKVIELLLQFKSAKAHGKNYINVKPHLVRHLCVIAYSLRVQPSLRLLLKSYFSDFKITLEGTGQLNPRMNN